MTILIVVLIVAAVIIMWATPLTSMGDQVQMVQTESKLMHEIMHADAQLHRLLLVETLARSNTEGIGDEATFEQMQTGMATLGNNLLSTVGHATSQRLSNLFLSRCNIFRNYYERVREDLVEKQKVVNDLSKEPVENSSQQETMANPQTLDAFSPISEMSFGELASPKRMNERELTEMSEHGVDDEDDDQDGEQDESVEEDEIEVEEERQIPNGARRPSPIHTLTGVHRPFRFDDSLENEAMSENQVNHLPVRSTGAILDETNVDALATISKRLELINREIIDAITAAFHLREKDEVVHHASTNKIMNRPFMKYDRLYTLLNMYDRELIQQGQLYSKREFRPSLNSHQGIIQIAAQIAKEFQAILQSNPVPLPTTG